MSKKSEIEVKLRSLLPVLSSIAVQCVKQMFEREAEIPKPWKVVERLDDRFEHLIAMTSANYSNTSLAIVGISPTSIKTLLEEDDVDQVSLSDELAEFLNSYCALLSDNDIFIQAFGKQFQKVPVPYNTDIAFAPFLRGVQGSVKVGNDTIIIGYVIRENSSSVEENLNEK